MLNQPFFQVALPLIITIVIAVWVNNKGIDGIHKRLDDIVTSNNKGMDGVHKRLDDIVARLTRIENLLGEHDRRITTLEASKWR